MFNKIVEVKLRDGQIKYAIRKGLFFYSYRNLFTFSDVWHRKNNVFFASSCLTNDLKIIKETLYQCSIPNYRIKELDMSELEQLIKGLK